MQRQAQGLGGKFTTLGNSLNEARKKSQDTYEDGTRGDPKLTKRVGGGGVFMFRNIVMKAIHDEETRQNHG